MAAFERVLSGTPSLDKTVDNIRMGDNVVWRVSDLDEFRIFVEPYADQAIKDGRDLIYVRFASHPPILEDRPGMKTVHIELSHRFEIFTVEIHNLIEKHGRDAFYIFDCLSELQIAWATDLMMGNFFKLTCPYLFILDTVAWFPVIRGKHSFEAMSKIRDTTQLFLDVSSGNGALYVRPVKVWRRSGPEMYLPHKFDPKDRSMEPLVEGVETADFYRLMNDEGAEEQNLDSWERFFHTAALKHQAGMDISDDCSRMCDIMLTRDENMRAMVKKFFTPEDYFKIRRRMIGTGMIGGKSCGMLLSRCIVNTLLPQLYSNIEEHDSYYVGSDVFYSYIVDNGFWDLRLRQRREDEYFSLAPKMQEKFRTGKFSDQIREQFRRLLEYFGADPVIVRSSSILEDGFGNAFAGKYESVFCANSGSPEDNLEAFEDAVRIVYASTMSPAALEYRRQRGLDKRDEQMALLVQRVSGSRFDNYFMPCAAGVGYSFSPYRMSSTIKAEDGMLRLVTGLGTAAVDRQTGTYPRIIQLTNPMATPYTTTAEKHRFAQRLIDVIDLALGNWAGKDADDVVSHLPEWLKKLVLSHDTEAENRLSEMGRYRPVTFVSSDGIIGNRALTDMLKLIMKTLDETYGCAVDIEYAINMMENGDFRVNLLQCRPLHVSRHTEAVTVPDVPEDRKILETVHAGMGLSRDIPLSAAVIIDTRKYYLASMAEKYEIARTLGVINRYFRDSKEAQSPILFTPGRICTSSPELGVPSSFAEISAFKAICEVSDSSAGFQPELSYGSHIFQDLVEAEILYSAVFENSCTKAFDLSGLLSGPNVLPEICPGTEEMADMIRVVRTPDVRLWYDMSAEHLLIAKI